MKTTKRVIIEENQCFSKSRLWTAQRQYYSELGVKAWGDVPFYITSNPFIAKIYSKLIGQFMLDWLEQNQNSAQPFYILELGAGTGQFSFYLLRHLKSFVQAQNKSLSFCYIMSDFTKKNVKFWDQHEALQNFINEGILDFAVFDCEKSTRIELIHQNKNLEKKDFGQPLIVIANYLFDSLTTDLFKMQKGHPIHESRVNIITSKDNISKNTPIDWKKVSFKYQNFPIRENYYKNAVYDQLLHSYENDFEETYLLFPIGCLKSIENLRQINEQILLISSDKGFTTPAEMDNLKPPDVDYHGSFSVMVNYDAVARYFISHDGDYRHQTPRGSIVSTMYTCGFNLTSFSQTQKIWQEYFHEFSAVDYFNLYENLIETKNQTSLTALLSFLTLSHWDPYVVEDVIDRIQNLLDDADEDTIHYLLQNIDQAAEQFYFLPQSHDIFFDIGVLFHEQERYRQALNYYYQSQKYFGKNYPVLYNIAFCQYETDQKSNALKNFKQALTLKPKSKEIKEWIKTIQTELT